MSGYSSGYLVLGWWGHEELVESGIWVLDLVPLISVKSGRRMPLSIFWGSAAVRGFAVAIMICAWDICGMVKLCGNHFTVL